MGWWNSAWTRRQRLTFNNAARSDNLLNVPVLVVLDARRFDRAAAALNGADLRFIDADGSTELPYEIEAWDASGVAYVWVKVPQIDARSSTDWIWLYYGNPSAPAPGTAALVWNSGYVAVWHLGMSLTDATSNQNNGMNSGSAIAPGLIASARSFNSTAGPYVRVPDAPSLRTLARQVTLSGWALRRAAQNNWTAIVTRQTGTGPENDFWLGFYNGMYRVTLTTTTSGVTNLTGTAAPLGVWTHLATVYDGTTARLFVDGVEQTAAALPLTGNLLASNTAVDLGADCNGCALPNSDFIDATIDEVRIEQVARSSAWISAQYDSMRDTLITYGPVER